MTRYRTIVADPPWDQGGTGLDFGLGDSRHNFERHDKRKETTVPYGTLSLADICALPVREKAEDNAHLYLWTTQKFLQASFDVARAWGFNVTTTLVWCKEPPGIQIGGAFRSSTEFIQFARRGSLPAIGAVDRRWFTWPRVFATPVGRGQKRNSQHSAKPDAFYDLVEQVSPGPYLELFARRGRLGDWHYWGDQSLNTAEVAA